MSMNGRDKRWDPFLQDELLKGAQTYLGSSMGAFSASLSAVNCDLKDLSVVAITYAGALVRRKTFC